jgi:hypothetical protein
MFNFSEPSFIQTASGNEYHPATIKSTGISLGIIDNAYHIGLEIKKQTDNPENNPKSRGAIQEAAGQVLKGLNGFVNIIPQMYWNKSETPDRTQINIRLMPAIFTTACLWTTDAKLNRANLETGELPVDSIKLVKRPWIYFQYPVSPGLRHYFKSKSTRNLQQIYLNEYVRTIAIISYDGIEDFFTKFVGYRSKVAPNLAEDV